MGKGEGLKYLLVASLFLIIITFVYGEGSPWPILKVCGQNPNSSAGFGEVRIGPLYFSCDPISDGVCPEDFQDAFNASLWGNCGNCTDPDCVGVVSGYVKIGESKVPGATVTSSPQRLNSTSPALSNSTTTNDEGFYSFVVPRGSYPFMAAKAGFDTAVVENFPVYTGQNFLNFTLVNGTCHSDCTNSYGRCSARCDGLNFSGGDKCQFYNATLSIYGNTAKELCDNTMLGTRVLYNITNSTHALFIDCCEGTPYSRYYSPVTVDTGKIKNLVVTEKVANYYNTPVKIIVAYWEPVR